MQTVRDCIKKAIKHTLRAVNESSLLEERLYKDFIQENNLTVKDLDRLIDPSIYRMKKLKDPFPEVPKPTNDELVALVTIADEFGVTPEQVLGRSRKIEIADARRIYYVILFVYFNYKLEKTGSRLNRDHSTVIHAVRRHDSLLSSDPRYAKRFFSILDGLHELIESAFAHSPATKSIIEFDKELSKERWNKLSQLYSGNKKLKNVYAKAH